MHNLTRISQKQAFAILLALAFISLLMSNRNGYWGYFRIDTGLLGLGEFLLSGPFQRFFLAVIAIVMMARILMSVREIPDSLSRIQQISFTIWLGLIPLNNFLSEFDGLYAIANILQLVSSLMSSIAIVTFIWTAIKSLGSNSQGTAKPNYVVTQETSESMRSSNPDVL